jgi:protein-tyrosine phosphatase
MSETQGIRGNYNIYNPAIQEARQNQQPAGGALTEQVWVQEMQDVSQMFTGDGSNFTSVSSEENQHIAASPVQQSPAPPSAAPAEPVGRAAPVVNKDGPLLNSTTFLKEDRYPGLNSGPNGEPPNLRKAGGSYGMAQPTESEIRSFLDTKLSEGKTRVLWTNLREEPVIYINGKTLTLRDVDHKGMNLENPGVSGADAEALEKRLKDELIANAKRDDQGRLLIETYKETGFDKEKNEPILEKIVTPVNESDIKTTREVFDGITREYGEKGITVDFNRVPISDEKKPDRRDIDQLIEQFKTVDDRTEVVFNCQAGRGRTTTGMTIFDMLKRGKEGDSTLTHFAHDDIKEQATPGYYRTAVSVVSKLKKYFKKDQDLTSLMNDQRKAGGADLTTTSKDIQKNPEKAKDFFERYYTLMQVYQYSKEQAPFYQKNFSEWSSQSDPGDRKKGELMSSLGIRDRGNEATAYA